MNDWCVVGIGNFDFSDHGYKLGEHCDWFKHDNYEDATRIVTIIKPADGLLKNPKPPGTIIEQLAEEVDMYPSLLVSSSTAIRVSQRLKCSESLFLLYAILCICCQSVTAMIGRTCTNGRICTAYRYRQSYRASRGCLCSRILPPTTRGSSGRSISTSVFWQLLARLLTALDSAFGRRVFSQYPHGLR